LSSHCVALRCLESRGGWPLSVTAERPSSLGVVLPLRPCLRTGSALVGPWTRPRILTLSEAFPRSPVPHDVNPGFIPLGLDPLQSFSPPRDRPTCRSELTSPELSRALQRHPRASPVERRSSPSRAGSALRFSQPLSGFLASSSSTALFRAATVPGHALSFRAFPSLKSWSSLEATSSLAVIHRSCRSDRAPPDHPWFPRRPGLSAQLPGSPTDHGLPFHVVSPPRFPVLLGCSRLTVPDGQLHPLRSVPPSTNPFASSQANPRRRSLLSWTSSPSETLFEPRSLQPARIRRSALPSRVAPM